MNNPSDITSPDSTAGFKEIADFMSFFAPEVSGRSSDAVTPEL